MDRRVADRIIVKNNNRMEMVINWYLENKHWIDREQFLAPLQSGVVELREEELEFTFENKDGRVEIAIYHSEPPGTVPIVIYDYDPAQKKNINRRIAPGISPEQQMKIDILLQYDNTAEKEALKYHALMMFMKYYREEVKVERHKEHRPAKRKKKRKTRQALPLVRRVYTVTEFDKDELEKPKQAKRKYTKPEHEVSVRGHLRRYKSGKVVWIRPSVRYKGKVKQHKEYEL